MIATVTAGSRMDQPARHPPERVRHQSAHHRQARAARAVHRRRAVVHRRQPPHPSAPVSLTQSSTAALLLIFAFGGYDVIGVPAGEATDPRRHVPFAFVVDDRRRDGRHDAGANRGDRDAPESGGATDAARRRLAAVHGCGRRAAHQRGIGGLDDRQQRGQVLTGSRMLFALAENGELPRFFGKIHPRYRTPANAIIFTTLVALGLALSGSFVMLAVASAVARLVAYTGACAATLRLRHPRFVESSGQRPS